MGSVMGVRSPSVLSSQHIEDVAFLLLPVISANPTSWYDAFKTTVKGNGAPGSFIPYNPLSHRADETYEFCFFPDSALGNLRL